MSLLDKITWDLNAALKSGDSSTVSILRFLIARLKNARINKGQDLTREEVCEEIAKEVKQHKESIAAFGRGGREDLVSKEKTELAILQEYLPTQLESREIEKLVDEAILHTKASGPADMGKVMGAVMDKVKGQADGAAVSDIVKSKLQRQNIII